MSSPVRDLVERYRSDARLRVEDAPDAWTIRLAVEGARFEIVVPQSVLEWFVSAVDPKTGVELWSDWVDYYDLPRVATAEDLPTDMARDLEHTVERLLASTARVVVRDRGPAGLEWRASGSGPWRSITMTELLGS